MEIISQNICFHYKYRDAGNYKSYGSVIFSNTSRLSIECIQQKLKEVLIDEEYFVPTLCKIPLIYNFFFDPELDHSWYELDYLDETNEEVTDERSIEMFIRDCSNGNFHAK